MRLTACFLLLNLSLVPAIAQSEDGVPFNPQHPVDAALSKNSDGSWTFVSFPAGSRLFVFSGDAPGKSNCYRGCASAWPPLLVSDDHSSQSVGHWTVILRKDGKRQWAYKEQPVYRRFHDLPTAGAENGFFPLTP